jgi:hypothetical protein
MNKLLQTILILTTSHSLLAQSDDGDLRMEKTFWGMKFQM